LSQLTTSSLISIDLPDESVPGMIAMRLVGPVQGFVLRNEGETAVGDLDGLIEHITASCRSDREKAEALFHFVIDDIKDWYYPAQGVDLTVEDLNVLVWGFGFGFCYDLGRLQAGLWARAGLRSRIVGWPVHTVAEVYYDDSWHLYDLQHRNFYIKEDGSVAGFHDLQADPELFYQNLNRYGLDPISYPPHHLEHWYGSAKPNFQDSNDQDYWKVERDYKLNLRVGEYFEIFYNEPAVIYHPDSWHQYYGEMTHKKDPPWPVMGRLVYAPDQVKQEAQWDTCTTPNGDAGLCIVMKSPYFFTEGWLKIPGLSGFSRIWGEVDGKTYFVGRLVGGNSLFSKYIEGSNQFKIILDSNEQKDNSELLKKAELYTSLQLSHLGLPKLKPGKNLIPAFFEAGSPQFSFWFQESTADLEIVSFQCIPENPKSGERAELIYDIKNNGTGQSQTASFTVHNNVTALMSETFEKLGVMTIPPLEAGETTRIKLVYIANKRMTWYGKNPYVQLFDAWIDIEKDCADFNRDNNRQQNYVLLTKENGELPELPGYVDLPGGH
jgi:hypothetical protein